MRLPIVIALMLIAGTASADPAEGIWQTEADKKGQTAYVDVQKCAKALCGKIVKVFSPEGQQISHKNVGRMIFWDVKAQGGGAYAGRALVPAYNKEYDAEMLLNGNRLTVKGCFGPICQSQKWARIQ